MPPVRTLLLFTAMLVSLFASVIVAARGHGSARLPQSAAAQVCAQITISNGSWCWEGVCVRNILLPDARYALRRSERQLLVDQPTFFGLTVPYRYEILVEQRGVISVRFWPGWEPRLRLGDLMACWGSPSYMQARMAPNRTTWQRSIHYVHVPSLSIHFVGRGNRISPYQQVVSITLSRYNIADYVQQSLAEAYSAWVGFRRLPPD